jgi:hypothetical protein
MTLKKFIVSFIIVGFYTDPTKQITALLVIFGIYAVYLIILSPYNNLRE